LRDGGQAGDVPVQSAEDGDASPQAGGVHQHASGPAANVELGDVGAHGVHALALLLARHGRGARQCGAGLLQVVGIDDERLGQFLARTGETAQDQHPGLVVAGEAGIDPFTEFLDRVVQAASCTNVERPTRSGLPSRMRSTARKRSSTPLV
jgi:hypothetical protein